MSLNALTTSAHSINIKWAEYMGIYRLHPPNIAITTELHFCNEHRKDSVTPPEFKVTAT
jgi:hypothetical protein